MQTRDGSPQGGSTFAKWLAGLGASMAGQPEAGPQRGRRIKSLWDGLRGQDLNLGGRSVEGIGGGP